MNSRILVPALLSIVVAVCAALSTSGPAARAALPDDADSYGWPVKPFDRPHPVRGNFGDPRTTFDGPPTIDTLMTSGGIFAFHFGVDISAADGTPVYPVRSGVVSLRSGTTIHVDSGDGVAFEYWHVIPVVRSGQQVIARETVLGHVLKGHEHVHFTELDHGRAVNPLARGHLGPYVDTTRPSVDAVGFRRGATGPELLPESIHGSVVLTARAHDMPALQVPGMWGDLPVAPALLTWRVERARDRHVVVREQAAFDVRSTLPRNELFWSCYARGTRQNMATFGTQRAWWEPGVYLYRLGPVSFDTRRLPNGIYALVVTATDVRGNRGTTRQVFIVRNGRQR